ncbi:Ocs element-binding factor 1 [Apostasia shenzhenica]|uniref:Ocs element-binding factor 1 n=1 Tax=Apostasia shenzhenica TaxID=1088818 RepID=A0A2I0ANB1_9ASPA|nr:Ocs element-binding factor 1 [Apostasia shenzhenica]
MNSADADAAAVGGFNLRPLSASESRRLRRMISNREYARRSRLRKQRHLEDLRSRVGRLHLENRSLADWLTGISCRASVVLRENELLRLESAVLRHRFSEIGRVLVHRQLQRLSSQPSSGSAMAAGGLGSVSELLFASLIT